MPITRYLTQDICLSNKVVVPSGYSRYLFRGQAILVYGCHTDSGTTSGCAVKATSGKTNGRIQFNLDAALLSDKRIFF